jgi:hypothetical protein
LSTVAFIRRCLDAGLSIDDALAAADAFEAESRPARATPPDEAVWVYVIGVDHPGDDLVKVGISKHPNFRLLTLESERGYNLYLAHTEGPFTRLAAALIERQAHSALASERERGEWFLCGADRAIETVRSCAKAAVQ